MTCPCSATAELETIKNFSFEVFNTIEQLQETYWNNQVPEWNKLMQYEQLLLIENSQRNNMQFRYVFIKESGATVGVAYFQVVHFTGTDLLNYFPDAPEKGIQKYLYNIATAISTPLIKQVDVKLLVSGNVFMTGENGFYFQGNIEKKTRGALLRKAVNHVLKTDSNIRAILISDLYDPKTEFDSNFKQCGYSEITVESDMSIKLRDDWNTFEDYMQSLSSKYRVRAKKTLSLCKENNVVRVDLNEQDILKHQDRLFYLYNKVMDRADFKLASLTKDFFFAQKKLMGDDYRVFAYFKDDVIIGFISLYKLGRRMEVHYTGMDAEVCKPIHLYQHMMYDMVEFGIQNKCERLHFGRTAPEIKSTIGAKPSAMYGYVKHLNPIFNRLAVRTFTARLKPKHYIIRDPFKQ